MQLGARECQGLPATTRSQSQGNNLSRLFSRSMSLLTPWLWTCTFQNCEKINCCFKLPGFDNSLQQQQETNTIHQENCQKKKKLKTTTTKKNNIQKTQFSLREKKFIRKVLLYVKDPKNRNAAEPQECPNERHNSHQDSRSVMFFLSVCAPFLFLTLPFSFLLFFLFSRSQSSRTPQLNFC